jgi:hypothetical protein
MTVVTALRSCSPLRLQVQFSVKLSGCYSNPSALLMCRELVNSLPNVMGFLSELHFPQGS